MTISYKYKYIQSRALIKKKMYKINTKQKILIDDDFASKDTIFRQNYFSAKFSRKTKMFY